MTKDTLTSTIGVVRLPACSTVVAAVDCHADALSARDLRKGSCKSHQMSNRPEAARQTSTVGTRVRVSAAGFFSCFLLVAAGSLSASCPPSGTANLQSVSRVGVESGCTGENGEPCFTREHNVFSVHASAKYQDCERVVWEFSDSVVLPAVPQNCLDGWCDYVATRVFLAPGTYRASARAYMNGRTRSGDAVMTIIVVPNPNPEPPPEPEPDPARRRAVRHR